MVQRPPDQDQSGADGQDDHRSDEDVSGQQNQKDGEDSERSESAQRRRESVI